MATVQFTPLTVTGVQGYALTMQIDSTARTALTGVNAEGVAFGSYTDDTGTYGIVDSAGTISVINVPGSIDTVVTGVDAAGNISGTYRDSGGQTQSFIDSGGTITTIQIQGAINVTVTGTDAAGDLFGFYATDTSGTEYGFVDSGGTITTIAGAGAFQTHVTGIDAAGDIVGYTVDDNLNEEGFVDSGGTFTTIDAPGSYAGTTQVTGVDAAGDVVGTYVTPSYQTVGFIDSGGTFTTINGPGAFQTEVTGVDAAGDAYGYYQVGDGILHGFVYSGGTLTPIANASQVTGTDAAGDIIGVSTTPTGSSFIDSGGTTTSVLMPGVFQPHITAVNGDYIAGTYQDSTGEHDFIYNGQTLTPIDFPVNDFIYGDMNEDVSGINTSGELVGNFYDQSQNGKVTPFLYNDGTVSTIVVPGALSAEATGIDAAGDVVGNYSASGGTSHGFVDQGGAITTIDVPGGSDTTIVGVDAAGDVFGTYVDSNGYGQLFVDRGGTFTTFSVIDGGGYSDMALYGVNAAGDAFGSFHADALVGVTQIGNPPELVDSFQNVTGGFTYSNGFVDLLANASVEGVDGDGNTIGTYQSNGQILGFVDSGASVSSFSLPGDTLYSIGADGTTDLAYGDYIDGNGIHHSFLLDLSPAAPAITGTKADQTTTLEASLDPFAGVTIGDSNIVATDTLTITLGGSGTLADGADFSGLSNPSQGIYVLSGTAQTITSELDALVFTPVDGVPGTSVTTTFTLSDASNASATPAVNSSASVIDSDPPATPVVTAMGSNVAASANQSFAATALFSASDAYNLPILSYEVEDTSTGAANGFWTLNGVVEPNGQVFTVTAAQLSELSFTAGSNASAATADTLDVAASDSAGFGAFTSFTVTAAAHAPGDVAPVVNGLIAVAPPESVLPASSVFTGSVPAGESIVTYEVEDTNGDWVFDGTSVAANQVVDVPAAQLSELTLDTGFGTDTLKVRANDGTQWGNFTTFQVAQQANAAPPADTTANMIMVQDGSGIAEIYDIGASSVLAAAPLTQIGAAFQLVGLGGFDGTDISDMLARNGTTGAFTLYDVSNNNVTGIVPFGQVGPEWTVSGFGDFSSHAGETDMLMRNSNTGAFELYDISNNSITSAASMGQAGLEWQVAGFGDFSGHANETDMLMRNSQTGAFEIYDIVNDQISGTPTAMGQVGLEWSISGFGDFSGNANETDMLMRNNATGAFEVYDISNNAITLATGMGQVGPEWSVGGIAADPATGASNAPNAQLVQAMASFAPSTGASDVSSPLVQSPAPFGSNTTNLSVTANHAQAIS